MKINISHTLSLKGLLVILLLSSVVVSNRLLTVQAEVDRNIKSYDIESSKWTPAQRRQHEVYAVGAGAHVSFSTRWSEHTDHYWLDYAGHSAKAWCSRSNKLG